MPLYELVVRSLFGTSTTFSDGTTLPLFDPGRGRTKVGRLWCYTVDDRPWCAASHSAAYIYTADRMDTTGGLALCLAHMRKECYQFSTSKTFPLAREKLTRIPAL